ELHISDAEYTVQITNQFTGRVLSTITTTVDQTSGGAWVKIAGPFTVPLVLNPTTGQTQAAIVTVTLDNTTNELVSGVSVTQLPNYHVVADAVQLRPDDGFIYGSPVSVNVSDYPELSSGYADAGIAADKVDVGGFPISYRAASEGAIGTVNGATAVATSGGNFFNGAVPNGEYTEDLWGDPAPYPYNIAAFGNKADPSPATPATVTQVAHRPIDQVVYTTRSINIGGFQSNIDQTIGVVYAIDGLTGNVIWRYPDVLPFTVDDAQTANGLFTATGGWAQGSPAQPAPNNFPGTDFFSTSYTRVLATAPPATATATWNLNQLSATDQAYYVYAWFPSAVPTEQHVQDAQYAVAGTPCNPVNQTAGGNWVQLTWNNTQAGQANDPIFDLAAGATVTLNNATSGPTSATTFVAADAVLVVPVNSPGPIASTPVVVRNMKVIVDPKTIPATYSTRTVVLFTDNSLGSTNGGGGTIIDNTDPANFQANGNFAPVATPGTDFFGTNYDVAPAQAASTSTASWSLPLAANAPTQAYFVFAWFLSATATEPHPQKALYTSDSIDPGTGAPPPPTVNCDPIDQTTGGRWVQLTYKETSNPAVDTSVFYFNGAHHSITLSDAVGDANPAGLFVTADAIKFVPATPASNFVGSRMYCLDAAGNADGDDTVVDQNGEPVSYGTDGSLIPPPGNAAYTYLGPLQPLHYGTTRAYWIWQPNPAQEILQTGANETPETNPDSNRDMPIPGTYQLNSPTVLLSPDPDPNNTDKFQTAYQGMVLPAAEPNLANVIVGNTNGVLYSVNGQGVLSSPTDQALRYQSADPNTPTVEVNWWFNTGGSIAYAPATNAAADPFTHDPTVYVTTYDPGGNNVGRVWAIDANKGPVGNGGLGDPKSGAGNLQVPGSLNYNFNQIPFWSFPDAHGTLKDTLGNVINLNNNVHLVTSKVAINGATGVAPALPLGDIAGAPSLYTAADSHTRLYVSANEPTPDGDGPGRNGRIYALDVDNQSTAGEGQMVWAFPDILGTPNAVGNTGQQATTFDFNPNGTATPNLPAAPLGAFTQFDSASGLWVSSSPVIGQVTFPHNLVPTNDTTATNLNSLPDTNVQMLYTGNTDGVLYALNLNVGDDPTTTADLDGSRLIYNDPIGDGPLVSTPALLSGSATNFTTAQSDVGGVVFLTSSVGNLWEIEATPFADPSGTDLTTPIVNTDWGWAEPGGLSSPGVGSFDTENFTATGASSPVNPSPTRDDSEWLYCGSDTGFLFGFTPNTSSGGGFTPGDFIPSQNIGPNSNIDLSRNFVSAVYGTKPGNPVDFAAGATPPANPSFDWGQTVYIAIFGIDNPAKNDGQTTDPSTGNPYPIGMTVTFTLTESGRSGRSVSFQKQIDLRDTTKIFPAANFPPAALQTAVNNNVLHLGKNQDGNYYVAVFPYQLSNASAGDPQTPGSTIQISNITETAISNGQQITITGGTRGNNIINKGTGGTNNFQLVPAIDQATFGILNPLGIATGGPSLNGLHTFIALSPASIATPPADLGPFNGVTSTTPFAGVGGYQTADANGSDIPVTQPIGGTDTAVGGTPADPTKSLNSQGMGEVDATVVVAADAGEIGHGTTGDTGTGITNNPVTGITNNPVGTNVPVADPTNAGFSYGASYMNIADRSALGSIGQFISDTRMDSPHMGWNDNSAINNANAVINMMPWDLAPVPVAINRTNPSPDYPNIADGNIHVQLLPRNENITGLVNGTQGDITNQEGALANANENGSPTARVVRPNPVVVQVTVPKFQPANLEAYDATSQRYGGEHSHTDPGLVSQTAAAGGWVPQGYMAQARVWVDTGGSTRWDPTKAFRTVNVWVGVPADMSTAIGQQTTDVGSIPGTFGLWNPNNAVAWTPYALSPNSTQPQYQPWYLPVPVYNTGNVNLLNVHFDQNIRFFNPTNNTFSTPQPLLMLSDTVADQGAGGQPLWPFMDDPLLGTYSGTPSLNIVRSSLDQDVYMNPAPVGTLNPFLINGATPLVPGPTAHKARPGEPNPGMPIKLPDEPHDTSNPDWVDPSTYPSHFYNGDPAVSIAAPFGTPVGSYSEALRTFEGSDIPYNGWTGPTYGQNFFNPGVWNSAAASQYSFVLNSNTNSPMQFFSDPGTVLKANVVESRMTDDAS
ncbi:MAG TPA: hypothetical protein VFW40_07810, partial [Capsulimonadaceae bacterium]|nr:hypothetical protein [Capsulimonadaceae bacterium]